MVLKPGNIYILILANGVVVDAVDLFRYCFVHQIRLDGFVFNGAFPTSCDKIIEDSKNDLLKDPNPKEVYRDSKINGYKNNLNDQIKHIKHLDAEILGHVY